MKKQLIILLLPLIFAGSCKTTKKTAADSANTAEVIADQSFRKPVKDAELFKTTTDLVPIDTVFISNDTLNVFTKKILGCDADNFKLIWNGDMGKAIPPQTAVKVFQLVDGACKERHKFHLSYNISPLKLKNDTSATKSTLIKVGGWGKMSSYMHN
jgi:hypothetical protein